jgi:signal transduction histidine kinase
MKSLQQSKAINILLYIMAAYVLFQLLWWGLQLYQLHEKIIFIETNGNFQKELLNKKLAMIMGEGLVFLVFLGVAFWWIRRNVWRDLKFAQKEKNFMQAITHELKTPIAAIKINAITLRDRELSNVQKEQLLQFILDESNRQELLIENILLSTQFENKLYQKNFSEINLSQTLQTTIKRIELLYPQAKLTIKNENESASSIVLGNSELLQMAFFNLIENGIKYSLPKGDQPSIEISFCQSGTRLDIQIQDQGVGIPLQDQSHIFKKFYRVGDENTRRTKGSGLGLYIVKSILELHQAKINVSSKLSEGSTFTLSFLKS